MFVFVFDMRSDRNLIPFILNKTKALVISSIWTVNPPHGDLVLSGVSTRAIIPTSPSLACSLTASSPSFEDHMRGIVSRVSQGISILRYIFRTPLCYFVVIMYLFSQSFWLFSGVGVSCMVNVTLSFSSATCIRWQGFATIRIFYHCIIDVMLLSYVYFTRLIRTRITICSGSLLPLLSEVDILKLRPHLIHLSLKYEGVDRPNLQGVSCRTRFECGMTFPTLCLTPERWMGSRVQLVASLAELCFLQFSVVQELVGLRKQFVNNFACAAGFKNNNNNNN